MKRFAAIIVGCMLLTGAMASCSSGGSSSENAASSASTEAVTAGTENTSAETTSQTTETTTTAKKTTSAEKTTEPETETETETEQPTVDPASLKGGDLTGEWVTSGIEIADGGIMTFEADGRLDMLFDISAILDFKDKKVRVYGDALLDVEFDGKTARAEYNGQECFVLERVSGGSSPDNMDGKYEITGGFMKETNDGNIIVIDSGNTYISSGDMYTYSTNGNELTIIMKRDENNSITETEHYGVDGDTLTIVDTEGTAKILNRKK